MMTKKNEFPDVKDIEYDGTLTGSICHVVNSSEEIIQSLHSRIDNLEKKILEVMYTMDRWIMRSSYRPFKEVETEDCEDTEAYIKWKQEQGFTDEESGGCDCDKYRDEK